MFSAVKDRAVSKAQKRYETYKNRADDVLLNRGKSSNGTKFKSGLSEDEIFSMLNKASH